MLGVKRATYVLRIVNGAKKRGLAVIFITHQVMYAMAVCDYFAVLMHGAAAAEIARIIIRFEIPEGNPARFRIEAEEAFRFLHGGKIYALWRSPDDRFDRTDGIYTQEHVDLTDTLVMDNTIKCPKCGGVFGCRTGEALGAPVCMYLKS